MPELAHQRVVVLGLGPRGLAACRLLHRAGARVVALELADDATLRARAAELTRLGARVVLGCAAVPAEPFDLAVLSPRVSPAHALVRQLREREVPIIGELELGFQRAQCLTVAIAGTNGRSTTARLITAMLEREQRRVVVCGDPARPVCDVADETKELDYLLLLTNAFQLETTTLFRPTVAVLTNLAADHLDRFADAGAYCRAVARLFANQEAFDWAIVQREALAKLTELGGLPPGKVITFSADDQAADLYFDRGLLLSRAPGWEGPLLDTATCALRGPHHAENLLAALAVGRALRLPLESSAEAVRGVGPAAHGGEVVAERGGVRFVNDSKANNPHAMLGAVRAIPPAPGGLPNVWLLAGGRDKGLDMHDAAPTLAQRVKGAFLFGESRETLRAAWGLFMPCMLVASLAEAVAGAAKRAVPGDTVLLAPACASRDQFHDDVHRGEAFRAAVAEICQAP